MTTSSPLKIFYQDVECKQTIRPATIKYDLIGSTLLVSGKRHSVELTLSRPTEMLDLFFGPHSLRVFLPSKTEKQFTITIVSNYEYNELCWFYSPQIDAKG